MIFQDAKAFEGDRELNCFKFGHFDLETFKLTVNGEAYPTSIMHFDWATGDFMDGFNSLFTSTDTFSRDIGIDISREDYKDGFSILAADLTGSGDANNNAIRDGQSNGDVSLDVHFKTILDRRIVMTVIGISKGSLEINLARQVITSYR